MAPTPTPTAPPPVPVPESSTDAPPRLLRWTRGQYEQAIDAGVFGEDDRVELITGHVVEMSPQNAAHATTVTLIDYALRTALPSSSFARIQLPLALSAESAPEPDVAIVEGTPADFAEAHPDTALLVVEVSSRSLAFDRSEKQGVYARAGIPTYWIANLVEGVLEVYTDPGGGRYRTVRTLEADATVAVPGTDATLPVGNLLP